MGIVSVIIFLYRLNKLLNSNLPQIVICIIVLCHTDLYHVTSQNIDNIQKNISFF